MGTMPPLPALNRRDFLRLGALSALRPVSILPSAQSQTGVVVNDVHAKLNPTHVAGIERPASTEALQRVVRRAAEGNRAVSIAGGRHAMGGQQFGTDTTLIDTRSLARVLSFDRDAGIVEVEGGVQWPELMEWLASAQEGEPRPWTIVQKQTGADRLSLGGALAANIHSRGLRLRPIIQDVESFVLVDAAGRAQRCSRDQNAELFALAIGGYGLFGPIASVRLRLTRRRRVQRVVRLEDVGEVMHAFEQRIADGFLYGDFQFATAPDDERFLRQGVFSCYRAVEDDATARVPVTGFSPAQWQQLAYLAHADPARAFDMYAAYYLSTNGRLYNADTQQLSYYADDYHAPLSQRLGSAERGSEMITEIYVPRAALSTFMAAAAQRLRRREVPLIYGTVRLIERDDESYLAWAREPWACIIFNLHVSHTEAGMAAAAAAFRDLIDAGLDVGGSYYLTYHRWARRDQVEAAHPRLATFLQEKLRHDPDERFQSDWYRHYRKMFGGEGA